MFGRYTYILLKMTSQENLVRHNLELVKDIKTASNPQVSITLNCPMSRINYVTLGRHFNPSLGCQPIVLRMKRKKFLVCVL